MGRKKKGSQKVTPKCFYCDRVFTDENQLVMHQKAKHFRCPDCGKKMTTTSAMRIHMSSVHKSELDRWVLRRLLRRLTLLTVSLLVTRVPNSKEGRGGVDFDVYGMEGLPAWFVEGRDAPRE